MPGMVRQSDITSGHDCFPPQIPGSMSSNVFVNNLPAIREGDITIGHCCTCGDGHGCHVGVYIGSSTVFINNKPAQKIGDPISCGCTTVAGSGNVFVEER